MASKEIILGLSDVFVFIFKDCINKMYLRKYGKGFCINFGINSSRLEVQLT